MRWKFLLLLCCIIFLSSVSATLNVSLSDQGTDAKIRSTGVVITSGNLTVSIYDALTGGNLIYEETFVNAITNGTWNVMLGENSSNPLTLEFGKIYYKDYAINGEDLDFTNLTGGSVERQFFYSPLGDISGEDISASANLTIANLTVSGNISASTGFFNLAWSYLTNVPNIIYGLLTDNNANNLLISNGTAIGYNQTVFNNSVDARITLNEPNLNVNSSSFLDSYNSSYFMPFNTSVSGNFDFNGGWLNNGLSIIGGDIYARVGYFYNISSLQVNNLNINGSLTPYIGFDNQFDIGSSDLRWRDLWIGRNARIEGIGNFSGTIYINNATDITAFNDTERIDSVNTTSNIKGLLVDQINGTELADTINLDANMNILGANFSINNSDLFVDVDTGRVGIGTNAPTEKLTVSDNILTTGDIYIDNADVRTWLQNFYDTFQITIGSAKLTLDRTLGNIGINTSTPANTLNVVGDTNITGTLIVAGEEITPDTNVSLLYGYNDSESEFRPVSIAADGSLKFSIVDTGGVGGWFDNGNVVHTASLSDFVGIGTSTPTEKLMVNGSLMIQNSTGYPILFVNSSSGTVGLGGTTFPSSYLVRIDDDNLMGNNVDLLALEVDGIVEWSGPLHGATIAGDYDNYIYFGNLGVGTPTPSSKLDVVGDFRVDGSDFFVNSTSGNVGIGTTSPSELLHINGSIRYGSNGAYIKRAFYRYYTDKSASNQYIHLKTNQPMNSIMTTIKFYGYEYSSSKTIDAQVSYYPYGATTNNVINIGTYGSHTCGAYKSSDGYAVVTIYVTEIYYLGFYMDAFGPGPQGLFSTIGVTAATNSSSATGVY